MKNKKRLNLAFVYVLLSVLAVIWLFPIFWIVMNSFRGEGAMAVDYIIPKTFTLDNYVRLFNNETFPFGKWFMNTLVVAIATMIISTFITVAMAYSLSRIKFKFRDRFLKLALVLNMFPGFMSMIAIYFIVKAIFGVFGLQPGLAALVILYSSGAALGFYIAKGFFDTIPFSLDESAMVDGATRADIFFKITLPLSQPIIVYTALMAFMGPWMDFIFAKVILGDQVDKYTVAIGLFTMTTASLKNQWFLPFTAGCVLIAVPITILFIFMQKYYVEGVTAGGVKG
jgi:arabinogalactan oligomer/maltooligosaccharide transport system permease protein